MKCSYGPCGKLWMCLVCRKFVDYLNHRNWRDAGTVNSAHLQHTHTHTCVRTLKDNVCILWFYLQNIRMKRIERIVRCQTKAKLRTKYKKIKTNSTKVKIIGLLLSSIIKLVEVISINVAIFIKANDSNICVYKLTVVYDIITCLVFMRFFFSSI